MRGVKVIFEDKKYNFETSINGTDKEIEDYYLKNAFNMGGMKLNKDYEEVEIDDMQIPISVEFLKD